MNTLRTLTVAIIRLGVVWLVDTLALLVTAALIRGITIQAGFDGASEAGSVLIIAAAAALVLGIVNLVLRPLVLLLSLPFGFFVVFAAGFLVNAVVLWVTSLLLPGFEITNIVAAIVGGLVFGILNTVLTSFLSIDDNNSFYQGLVDRLAKRDTFKTETGTGAGLELPSHSQGHRRGLDADAQADDGRGALRHHTHRLRAAVADLGMPGRHHVRRQPRHPRLPLVRQGQAAPVCLRQGRQHAQPALREGPGVDARRIEH
jgi:putative membrane protein